VLSEGRIVKIDTTTILGGLGVLLLGLLGFIAGKVWDGVEIAQKNQVKLEMVIATQIEIRADQKATRSDLDVLYGAVNDVARGE
jgi:hypothetical protein